MGKPPERGWRPLVPEESPPSDFRLGNRSQVPETFQLDPNRPFRSLEPGDAGRGRQRGAFAFLPGERWCASKSESSQ